MKNTVAIVGSHPRTRGEFDFQRTDCDVWVFNEAISNNSLPRADAVFQMHEEAIWRNPANRNDPKHYDWLRSQMAVDVYMQEVYPDVIRSVRFPLEEIQERFHISYFTSSVAYALALACVRGYKRVELYGVEMETNTEYQYQRDGVTFWIGVALGCGMEVDAHVSMFEQPLYGYQGEVTVPYERFESRIAELRPKLEQMSIEYRAGMGIIQNAFNLFINDGSAENEGNLYAIVQKQCGLGEAMGMIDGALQENEKYKGKADKMREVAGDYLFSRQEFESSAKNLTDRAAKAHEEFISHGTVLGVIHDNIKRSAKQSPKRLKLAHEYIKQLDTYFKKSNQASIYRGASNENYSYMGWLDKHIRAAGGAKSEAVLLEALQNA